MGKTTVEQSKDKHIVVNRLTYPEAINELELEKIAEGQIKRLIPITTETTKKAIIMKTTVTGMMTLKTYFNAIIRKKMFLNVVAELVAVVKECEKNLLNVNNLMLDWDYIFLDLRTKKIKCIFWPIVNNTNASSVPEFFRELPFRVVFSKHEDHGYVKDYLLFFKNNRLYSTNSFEKFIFEMMGREIQTKTYFPSGSSGSGDSQSFSEKAPAVKGSTGGSIAYNPLQPAEQIVCPKCGKAGAEGAKFCTSCGSPLAEPAAFDFGTTPAASETTVLGAEEYGGTTVLGADEPEPAFPYLIREKTQEKISVNKPSFRIGKERRYCDYFVVNNNAISRSHADIITKDSRYYIIDNNSTNKTYVDGRVIPVKKEVEIFSGTRLRLANEDFVFYI